MSARVGVAFSETLAGPVAFGAADPVDGLIAGRRAGDRLRLDLRIDVDDLSAFVADPAHAGRISGTARWDRLGQEHLVVESGAWNLFVDAPDRRHRQMRYALRLRDAEGRTLELVGFKQLTDDADHDPWSDGSTLFTTVAVPGGAAIAAGVLRITRAAFVRLLAGVRAHGGTAAARAEAKLRFARLFAGGLLDVYAGPALPGGEPEFPTGRPGLTQWQGHAPGVWHPVPTKPRLERRILPVAARDGTALTVHHLRRAGTAPAGGPVLLLHGCATRANVFYAAPRTRQVADALLDAGHDVWVGNWRGSIDLPPSSWTLDEVAVHDQPALVAAVRAETGARSVQVVAHCQGATSVAMAAVAGLLPDVRTVVTNAVTLHVAVPPASARRQQLVVPLARRLTPGASAQWAARPPSAIAAALAGWGAAARREATDPVLGFANFLYGVGPDVLFSRDALADPVARWLPREFGYAPFSFFEQMRRSVRAGHVVPVSDLYALPRDLLAGAPRTGARFTLLAGTRNTCFVPAAQERTHAWLDAHAPGRHALRLLDGRGHQDPWFARDADRDVHPVVLAALAR